MGSGTNRRHDINDVPGITPRSGGGAMLRARAVGLGVGIDGCDLMHGMRGGTRWRNVIHAIEEQHKLASPPSAPK